MAHCLWHNWKLFVVASVDWCVMVLQKIYQIMLQLYSVCFCSTATRCDLFLYTCTCLWRIKLLVVFVWYLWVIVVSESLYSIQWWMTMFVAFICVCLSAADCHIYWEGPLSIMCYRCCGGLNLSSVFQTEIGIVFGVLDWKCINVIYYIYKTTFVENDIMLLYIGTAWIDWI